MQEKSTEFVDRLRAHAKGLIAVAAWLYRGALVGDVRDSQLVMAPSPLRTSIGRILIRSSSACFTACPL